MPLKISIVAIGKLKAGPEADLYGRYAKRFQQTGKAVGLGPLALIEFAESRAATAQLRKAEEGKRLFDASAGMVRLVLAERGQALTSEAFADVLRRHVGDGAAHLGFLIGGADGHRAETVSGGDLVLSLGQMTLTHGLARVVLAEQLYRATTILSGHPYHRA